MAGSVPLMSKLSLVIAFLLSTNVAFADGACPAAATDAAKKKFPDATITKCIAEKSRFEVKMEKKDHSRIEVEVTAKGEILAIEEIVPVSALPEVVTKAFAAKYPKATANKVEKITMPKITSYEIAFTVGKQRREATFEENGTFVEEE